MAILTGPASLVHTWLTEQANSLNAESAQFGTVTFHGQLQMAFTSTLVVKKCGDISSAKFTEVIDSQPKYQVERP